MAIRVRSAKTAPLAAAKRQRRPSNKSLLHALVKVTHLPHDGALHIFHVAVNAMTSPARLGLASVKGAMPQWLGIYGAELALGPCPVLLVVGAWLLHENVDLLAMVSVSPASVVTSITVVIATAAVACGGRYLEMPPPTTLGRDDLRGLWNRALGAWDRVDLVRNADIAIGVACLGYLSIDKAASVAHAFSCAPVLAVCSVTLVGVFFATQSPRNMNGLPTSVAWHFSGGLMDCFDVRLVGAGVVGIATTLLWDTVALSLERIASMFMTGLGAVSVAVGGACWVLKGADPIVSVTPTSSAAILVSQVVHLFPFASFYVVWIVVFGQLTASFQAIVMQTDVRIGSHKPTEFDSCSLFVGYLLDHLVYPGVATLRDGKGMSSYERVVAGFVLCAVAMVWTGHVEMWHGESVQHGLDVVEWRWVYMMPSYILVSLAECLVQVTAMEVFYKNVPPQLKSPAQAMLGVLAAMGDSAVSILTLLFTTALPGATQDDHPSAMHLGLTGFVLMNVAAYVVVMRRMQQP